MLATKSWFKFYRNEIPDWPCPTCGKASLNLIPEEFHVHDSGETAHARGRDDFGAEWVQYRFSAMLRCSNSRCNEFVAMIGSGDVAEENSRNEDGNWDTSYRDCFTPSFFEPCLLPISIPKNTPAQVKSSLERSFSLIFANRDAATNQLRVALEVLLDEQCVKSIAKDGTKIKLNDRVQDHLGGGLVKKRDLISHKGRLSAIQWIGNDGSHGNDAITEGDLLSGLELIESVLDAIYPTVKTDLDDLARRMVDEKRPKKKENKK